MRASGNLPNQQVIKPESPIEAPVNAPLNNTEIAQMPAAWDAGLERSGYCPAPYSYFRSMDAFPIGNVDYNGLMGFPQMQYYNYSTMLGGRPGFYYPF